MTSTDVVFQFSVSVSYEYDLIIRYSVSCAKRYKHISYMQLPRTIANTGIKIITTAM